MEKQISNERRGNSVAKIPKIRPEVFGGDKILLRPSEVQIHRAQCDIDDCNPILLTVVGMRTVKNNSSMK